MLNGLDDLQIESTSSTFGKLVLGAMLIVFAAASMITTFSFFVTYAPGLGRVLHPEYGAYIAGGLGVLLFDLAGLGWTVLRSQNSDTTKQFVIASIAAVLTILLALLVSALQVVLSSSFDVGLYNATGGLSEFGQNMQLVGVGTMTLGFILNFACIAAYVNVGKSVTAAVQSTQLRAYVTAGKFAADQARAEMVTRKTLEGVFKLLPDQAAQAGQENTADYMNHTFGRQNGHAKGNGRIVEQTAPPAPSLTKAKPLELYRQRPGQQRGLIGDSERYQYQKTWIDGDTGQSPPGTRYWIMSGNNAVYSHTIPDDDKQRFIMWETRPNSQRENIGILDKYSSAEHHIMDVRRHDKAPIGTRFQIIEQPTGRIVLDYRTTQDDLWEGQPLETVSDNRRPTPPQHNE